MPSVDVHKRPSVPMGCRSELFPGSSAKRPIFEGKRVPLRPGQSIGGGGEIPKVARSHPGAIPESHCIAIIGRWFWKLGLPGAGFRKISLSR
mgnify:CR=1 FL=1|jgi:hypothetical protein